MGKIINTIAEAKQVVDNAIILYQLSQLGFHSSEAEPLADGEEAFDDTEYWTYRGPLDERTRPFCSSLLRLDRYWTTGDLEFLSRKVGYDVFNYIGGFNCRHQWQRARIKGRVQKGYVPKTPTRGQVDRAAVRNPSSNQDYFPR